MRRRDTVYLVVAGLIEFVCPVRADERIRRIGLLLPEELPPRRKAAWLQGLREHGYTEGRNLQTEYRYYHGQIDRLPALAAELAALHPALIVAGTTAPALAVRTATPETPLVFVNVGNPLGNRLVESLAHPGGNATGLAAQIPEGFRDKQMQIFRELVPGAARIAYLENPANPSRLPPYKGEVQPQIAVEASQPEQFAPAFEAAVRQGAEAIIITGDPLTVAHSHEIVALAARYRLPAMYFIRQHVVNGGLISFGADLVWPWRRVADYVDQILRGAGPADLPVQQPTKYELVVNRKTATSLGLTIPPAIVAQADEIIE